MKRIFVISVLILSIIIAGQASAAGIKMAIVAPDGSAWVNTLKEMSAELKTKTAGRWELNLYPGGVAGDEKVVIKKMKIGQIDAAGFTGVGLGEIYPAMRVFELPFLFSSSEEIDYVVEKLMPEIKSGFAGKGFEFLGWAESGFVYILSNKSIKSLKDMSGVKMWMWEGDPLAKKMFDTFGVVPVPLAIQDVLMALQTNMINGVYAPPLAAVALQWFSKTKYMSDVKLVDSIGAMLMTKRAWNKMSPADQNIMRELSAKYSKKIVSITRSDNIKAIEAMKAAGIKIVKSGEKNLKELKEKSETVWTALAGKLYPQELLDKVIKYKEEFKK